MCSRNGDCALCSTFEGKSLEECKKLGRCEANALEVKVVDDIKTKTGMCRCERSFLVLLLSCTVMVCMF